MFSCVYLDFCGISLIILKYVYNTEIETMSGCMLIILNTTRVLIEVKLFRQQTLFYSRIELIQFTQI